LFWSEPLPLGDPGGALVGDPHGEGPTGEEGPIGEREPFSRAWGHTESYEACGDMGLLLPKSVICSARKMTRYSNSTVPSVLLVEFSLPAKPPTCDTALCRMSQKIQIHVSVHFRMSLAAMSHDL
jgi:hypothetical protein